MLFHPWRRPKREADLEQEIQSDLEMAARDHFERGETAEKARADARREFGNVGLVKEATRAIWGWVWLEQFGQDLRYAIRMLRRSPGFTAVAALSLALGIGANTATFSVINGLLLRTLPVRNPEELVRFVDSRAPELYFPYSRFEKLRDLTDVFSDVSSDLAVDRSNLRISGADGSLELGQTVVGLVSGNYFSMLGINAVRGRTLTPDDDRVLGAHPVAVISYAFWETKFALAPDIVGRTFKLNTTTYTIVGVTPRGVFGSWVGRPTDLWIPVMMEQEVTPERPWHNYNAMIFARLRPGVTIHQARAAGQVAYQQILRDETGPNPTPQRLQEIAHLGIDLESGARGYSEQRRYLGQPLVILMAVVGLVLLIACANVANLLLARSAARQRELTVRLAIGAGRLRIARQLLTESALLSAMGGALGMLFAISGTKFLAKSAHTGYVGVNANTMSVDLDLHPDVSILVFTGALCLLTALLFGLAPALRGSRISLAPALTGRGADFDGSTGRFSLGKALVISQVAASLLLIITAGLFVRTLHNLESQNLGVDREHLLLVWTAPMQTGRINRVIAPLFPRVGERIAALPGVRSASVSVYGLLNGHIGGPSVMVDGYVPKSGEDPKAQFDLVMPEYFETLGLPLLAGRDFTERDDEAAPRVAIISKGMARYFFGDDSPIGKRFGAGTPPEVREIVGVVGDAKQVTPRDHIQMMYYVPYRQDISHLLQMVVAVRAASTPMTVAASIRQELEVIDPGLPVIRIDTVDDQLNDLLMPERLIAKLAGFLGTLAVLLACVGLYGIVSYGVARRTNEVGVRMALGATRAKVLTMVLREGLLLVGVGIAIGFVAAVAATRLTSAMLFGISPTDPITIVAAMLLMISVATFACLLPARKASSADPMAALRYV